MRFLSSLILSVLFFAGSFVEANLFTMVPPALKQAVDSLYRFPDTREFLDSLEKDGGITLRYELLGPQTFSALWFGEQRVIVLNASKGMNEGKKITSILFELHNARANSQLMNCDRMAWANQISKSQYVEMVEKIEYQNVLSTSRLIDKAISKNYFPREAYSPVHGNFYDHYQLQIQMGHSAFIAQRYDTICPY